MTRTGRLAALGAASRPARGSRRRGCERSAGRLGIALVDRVDRLAQDLGRVLQRRGLLGPELDLELAFHPLAPDDGRDRQADVADPVWPVDQRRDRQDPLLIERDRSG